MKRMKSLSIAILLFHVTMCSYSQKNTRQEIRSLNRELEENFNSNNMSKVAAFYLDTAFISGMGPDISGRHAIDQYWDTFKDRKATWKLQIDKIEDFGELVLQRGRSFIKLIVNNQPRESSVKFLLVWKKVNGGYRILYDVYSVL